MDDVTSELDITEIMSFQCGMFNKLEQHITRCTLLWDDSYLTKTFWNCINLVGPN